jgi:1-acyl-sn-glycerol-3-phosphate acyltransferase
MDAWKLDPAHDLGLPPAERLRSLKREGGLVDSLVRRLWWTAVRAYFSICHRLEVRGREHLPAEPPYVLIANHESHLDALLLASSVPARLWDRLFPIAAGDVFFETPAIAVFAAFVLNALPMWRKHCGPHALQQLRERLVGEGCVYILFPAGARSRDGRMLPFKAGLGMILAGTEVPVVPCHLEGAYEAVPPDSLWPRFRRIRVTIGEPMRFADTPNDRAGWQAMAAACEAAVRGLGGEDATAPAAAPEGRAAPLDY